MAADTPTAVEGAELSSAIASGLRRVEEFEYIRKKAAALGIRVWLFGGTAAGLAHYAHWDVQRQQGEARFDAERFDYHYTNIYRSNQDIDLVVDGPLDAAEKLEQLLQTELSHLAGMKLQWEVRMLRERRGDKEPLLGTDDFISQHSDSNSIGLVEITDPPKGEPRVRDLRAWDSPHGVFLRDVEAGKVSYLFSDRHAETSRAMAGKNPALLSAIRFVIKAAQFRLAVSDEDRKRVREVVKAFDRKKDQADAYVPYWLDKNARKIFLSAVDLDYAARLMDDVGMRELLVELGDKKVQDSFSWWLNRVPLPDRPLATSGRTAAELNLTEVAHETVDFRAYESITAAPSGEPNVLISRENAVGEAAVYGNGFYTQVGRQGARGTGWTIRFQMNPNAREGVDADFSLANGGTYVVVHNRRAIRVIPESLKLTPVQYFEMLKAGIVNENGADRAIFARMERRVHAELPLLTVDSEAYRRISEIVTRVLESRERNELLLDAWMRIPAAADELNVRMVRLRQNVAQGGFLRGTDRWLINAWLRAGGVEQAAAKDPSLVSWAIREVIDHISDEDMIAIFRKMSRYPEASGILADRMLGDRVPELWQAVAEIGLVNEVRPELRGLWPKLLVRAKMDQRTREHVFTHFFVRRRDPEQLPEVLPLLRSKTWDGRDLAMVVQSLVPGKFGVHEATIIDQVLELGRSRLMMSLVERMPLSVAQLRKVANHLSKYAEWPEIQEECGNFVSELRKHHPEHYDQVATELVESLSKGPKKVRKALFPIATRLLAEPASTGVSQATPSDLKILRKAIEAGRPELFRDLLKSPDLPHSLHGLIYEMAVQHGDRNTLSLIVGRKIGPGLIEVHEKAFGALIEKADSRLLTEIAENVFALGPESPAEANRLAPFLVSVIRSGDDTTYRALLDGAFSGSAWSAHPELFADLLRRGSPRTLAKARELGVVDRAFAQGVHAPVLAQAIEQPRYSARSQTLAAAGLGSGLSPSRCVFMEVRRLFFDRGAR